MKFCWFAPLLAGAGPHDRIVAAIGAAIGITLTGAIAALYAPPAMALFLAGSIGASTVLIFAVPTSPLAQPWPVIGGSTVSALSGIAMLHLLGQTPLAAGAAVGLAILAMSALRCLHAPGGGYALGGVLGGNAALSADWHFALVPVAANATVLVLFALLFHRYSGHSYPHRAAAVAAERAALLHEDVEAALDELGETFDIAPEDLEALLAAAQRHAQARLATPPRRR